MKPFAYSTAGKPPEMKDTPEEELTYLSLATASNNCFTTDDVRLIRRMFDRADTNGDGIVNCTELAALLSSLGDVSGRLIKAVLDDDAEDQQWSFTAFVHWTRVKLSSDDRLKLMTMEIDYIRSMGIDRSEEQAQKEFSSHRAERKKSQGNLLTHHDSSESMGYSGARRASKTYSNSAKPNDVDAYKSEFGLE